MTNSRTITTKSIAKKFGKEVGPVNAAIKNIGTYYGKKFFADHFEYVDYGNHLMTSTGALVLSLRFTGDEYAAVKIKAIEKFSKDLIKEARALALDEVVDTAPVLVSPPSHEVLEAVNDRETGKLIRTVLEKILEESKNGQEKQDSDGLFKTLISFGSWLNDREELIVIGRSNPNHGLPGLIKEFCEKK